MRKRLYQWFRSWAASRSPLAAHIELQHKTIYVFPGLQGLSFLVLIALIWLLGTNYQNNNILGFCFLLISIFVISIVYAFKNLLGLQFSAGAVQHSTLGELAVFDVVIRSRFSRAHYGLYIDCEGAPTQIVDLPDGQSVIVRLHLPSTHRGWQRLPCITLRSYFPFGVIRAWSYLSLDHKALIFPRPIENLWLSSHHEGSDEQGRLLVQKGDEFSGFSSYQQGQPLTQVAWKHYARGAGLLVKDYRQQSTESVWIKWDDFQHLGTELALSHMAYWVDNFYQRQQQFGVVLPRQTIACGEGEVHRIEVLTALALFGWQAP